MEQSIPQITVDTDVVTDWTRPFDATIEARLKASKKLLELHNEGKIKLWYLPNEERYNNPQAPNDLIENPGIIIIGRWRAGEHRIGSDSDTYANNEIRRILNVSVLASDYKHGTDGYLLLNHYHNKRDYFVTGDKHTLKQKDILKQSLNIEVLDPVTMIQHLQTLPGI